MPLRIVSSSLRAVTIRRTLTCLLALVAGLLSAAALLLVTGGPVRLALAAPLADTITVTVSIQDTIDAALPGDTIFVPAGTYTESLTLSQAVSLTGELSSTTIIHAVAGQRVLTITGAAVNSTVVISGLTFTGGDTSGDGGGLSVEGNAQPRLENLIIASNNAASGGGLHAASGSPLKLTNVAVLSNTTTYMGGAGMSTSAALDIVGGVFQGNHCTVACIGGGLFAGQALTLTDVQFISNTSRGHAGGGVYAYGMATVVGGLFQGNQCLDNCTYGGGGLHAQHMLVLTGTQFLSNAATHAGGGVIVYGGPPSYIHGALFQGNWCSEPACTGGGVSTFFDNGLYITDTQFISNTSQSHGGGLYVTGAWIEHSVFQGNACLTAGCTGGGLSAGLLALTDTEFIGNIAQFAGGGVYAAGAAAVEGGLFQGNACLQSTCLNGGLMTLGSLALSGTQFIGNSAELGSGGAYAEGAVTARDALFQANTCAHATCQGAGLMAGGTLDLTDTHFLSNTSQYHGGAARAIGAVTLNGGTFEANTCLHVDCLGGALYAGSTLALSGTQLISNAAGYGGGGLWAQGAATLHGGVFERNSTSNPLGLAGGLATNGALTLTDTQFLTNTAHLLAGGAIAGGPATLNGGLFQGNACLVAPCAGGGLHAENLALTSTQFINNHAVGSGGGLFHGSNTGRLVNVLFAGNSAGSGMALVSNGSLVILHTTIASPTLAGGSAIALLSGTLGLTSSVIASYTVGIERLGGSVWEDYNLFSGVPTTATGAVTSGGHSLSGPAAFSNPAAGNYRLTGNSVALDAGTAAGITTDFEGDPRPQHGGFDAGYDEVDVLTALTISKTDGQTQVVAGAPLTYTIVLANTGPDPAAGVLVTDTLPSGLEGSAWTCEAGPGSTCPASGSGDLTATVTVDASSRLTFTLHATTTVGVSNSLTNTATFSLPAHTTNTATGPASATDTTDVIFIKKVYLPFVRR